MTVYSYYPILVCCLIFLVVVLQWGFRRCEDICWVKTNKSNATPGLRHDSHTLFHHSKVGLYFLQHCFVVEFFYFIQLFRNVIICLLK